MAVVAAAAEVTRSDAASSNAAPTNASSSNTGSSTAASSNAPSSTATPSNAASGNTVSSDAADVASANGAVSGSEGWEWSTLLCAFKDDNLCEHFLNEPSVFAGKSARIVRVGPPGESVCGIRSKSVGIVTFKKCKVLWAADVVGSNKVVFARVRNAQGTWSPILPTDSANALGRLILQQTTASKNTKISAPKFFGIDYFDILGDKRHRFSAPTEPLKCFSCGTTIIGKPRYDEVSLARLCDSSGCRNRKRKADIEEDEGE